LAVKLHQKFYSSMPFMDFANKVGLKGPDPTEGMSTTKKVLAGVGQGMTNLARGVGQAVGLVSDDQIAESRRQDAPLLNTPSGMAGSVLGGVAATAPAMLIPGANTLVGSTAIGAGVGALNPTAEGESRLSNAGVGAVGGAGGYGAGKLLGRAISPVASTATPSQARVLSNAEKLGARATPGSATGSTGLRQLEASAESFPFMSGPFSALKQGNQTVLNRSAAKAIGENADSVTGDVLKNAHTRIGAEFAKVEAIPSIPVGNTVQNKLASIEMKYRGLLDKPLAQYDIVDDVYRNLGGNITGKQYNTWQSQLRQIAQDQFSRGKPKVGFALFEVKDALDDAASASMSGRERMAFQQARQQWKNLVMLESGNVVNEQTGNVSGAHLKNILTRKDKHGFRLGGNSSEMYDMARFNKAFPGIVGDSGTATRSFLPSMATTMMATGGLGAAGGVYGEYNPAAAAGIGALAPLAAGLLARGGAGAYLSPMGQAYFTNQALGPGLKGLLSGAGGITGANAALLTR
jgi:hypothetical protein